MKPPDQRTYACSICDSHDPRILSGFFFASLKSDVCSLCFSHSIQDLGSPISAVRGRSAGSFPEQRLVIEAIQNPQSKLVPRSFILPHPEAWMGRRGSLSSKTVQMSNSLLQLLQWNHATDPTSTAVPSFSFFSENTLTFSMLFNTLISFEIGWEVACY